MASNQAPKRSPLTQATITPPSIDRQHSYNARATFLTTATAVLANLRSRSASPSSTKSSPATTPLETPAGTDRRTSWEDCTRQRDGYISFPDFDHLRAQAAQHPAAR